jgi:hypothetical protein
MPPPNKRPWQSWHAAVEAKRRFTHWPTGNELPTGQSEYFSDTEFEPLRIKDAEEEVAAQWREEDPASEEEVECQVDQLFDDSESISDSGDSVPGSWPDAVKVDCWSQVEA